MENPFSWDYLTTVPGSDETFTVLPTTYLIVCIVGLIGSVILYNRPAILSSRHLLRKSATRTWASVFIWIFVIGLFFFAVRWLQINPFGFGQRLWMYLTVLAATLAAIAVVTQMRVTSPQISTEVAQANLARARGVSGRRLPRRSRSSKH